MKTIVGVREYSFVPDGKDVPVTGFICFYTEPAAGVDGETTGRFSLSFRKSNDLNYLPRVGDKIDVFYDARGKIAMIDSGPKK